jgi:hypothetical protein
MKSRVRLITIAALSTLALLAALAPAALGAPGPALRGHTRFCPSFGTITLRPGQACVGPARGRISFVDSAANRYATGGYGLCVGVVDYFHRFVKAPAGRNPRCGHTNYVANYLGDLYGGLTGYPAVLNASAVPLQVQSSYTTGFPY